MIYTFSRQIYQTVSNAYFGVGKCSLSNEAPVLEEHTTFVILLHCHLNLNRQTSHDLEDLRGQRIGRGNESSYAYLGNQCIFSGFTAFLSSSLDPSGYIRAVSI